MSGAADLAADLRRLRPDLHGSTGILSMLDEGALRFQERVAGAQRAFSAARVAHMDSLKSHDIEAEQTAWRAAVQSAHALADALGGEPGD